MECSNQQGEAELIGTFHVSPNLYDTKIDHLYGTKIDHCTKLDNNILSD